MLTTIIAALAGAALYTIFGAAVVFTAQAELARAAAAARKAQEPGRHRDPADEPLAAEQAWARLAESMPPAEAEADAELTPTDSRLRISPAVAAALSEETTPLPRTAPPVPAEVAAAVELYFTLAPTPDAGTDGEQTRDALAEPVGHLAQSEVPGV